MKKFLVRKEKISEAIGAIDEKFVVEAAEYQADRKAVRRRGILKWGSIAACLMLVIAAAIPKINDLLHGIELSDASHGVTVKYASKVPEQSMTADLAYLTEDELFTEFDTVIFRGTVTKIDNIELDFNGFTAYRALAEIEISEVYRGEVESGNTVTALLTCPVGKNIWVSETETVASMREGMNGIFMLNMYDESSLIKLNGATLALTDLADCGFPDGLRYAFLETEDGLIFDLNAYPSISDATTLDEIEEYVISMIEKSEN